MTEKDKQLKQKVWKWFKTVQTVHLATWDGKYPRVRPMALIYHEDKFWVSTGASAAKVEQITSNPAFEFSMTLERDEGMGILRCSGVADVVEDNETKASIAGKIPMFHRYWDSPKDPGYGLIHLKVEEVDVNLPGEMISRKFKIQD